MYELLMEHKTELGSGLIVSSDEGYHVEIKYTDEQFLYESDYDNYSDAVDNIYVCIGEE